MSCTVSQVAIFWFDLKGGVVRHLLLSIVDLAGFGDAAHMTDALIWVLTEKAGLDIKDCIYCCTDSTNSMSGTGEVGGSIEQFRRSFIGLVELIPRAPCTLHSLHLGVANHKDLLYYGVLPSISQRDQPHLWNLFWSSFKLFGQKDCRMYLWKDMCTKADKKLGITFKPVATRWLNELFASDWHLVQWDTLLWLHDEIKRVHGPSQLCVWWKRVKSYLDNALFLAQTIVFHAYMSKVVLSIHVRLCQSKADTLYENGVWSALPAGFNAPHMGDACRYTRTLTQSCFGFNSLYIS